MSLHVFLWDMLLQTHEAVKTYPPFYIVRLRSNWAMCENCKKELIENFGCREGGKTNGISTPYPKVENPTAAEDLWYIVEDGEVKIAGLVNMDILVDGVVANGKVTIPEYVTKIAECAFYNNTDATEITFSTKNIILGEYAFCGVTGLKSIELPKGVVEISNGLFSGCTGLTKIVLPNDLKEIGEGAFAHCPNLTLTVTAGSYAETYAKENNIPYVVK